MSWDDQNDKNRKKGPWGAKPSEPSGGNDGDYGDSDDQRGARPPLSDAPPDIDTVLRQAQEKFSNAFGFGGGGTPRRRVRSGPSLGIAFLVLVILWLASGLYRVLPEENAVILTFGKWTSTRGEAGLGYHLPWPIQQDIKVNVAFDRRVEVGFRDQGTRGRDAQAAGDVSSESRMLTGDENIVDIDFVVTWRISDARNFLFEIRDPETTVKKVGESALREIVGQSPIQRALTEGRADIEARSKDLMQKMLDEYKSGIVISGVQLLRVDPPEPVVDAFDDVQRARADKERIKSESETYRNDIVPRARGEAQKLIRDAEAYKEAATSRAKGEAGRFQSVYAAYAKAKDVTEKRIYIETMQQIMQGSNKVIMETGKTGSPLLPYLPLNNLPQRTPPSAPASTP